MPQKTSKWGALVKCPFYKSDREKNRSISCEGVFEGSISEHRFRRQRDREKQLRLYCAADYSKCEIYQAIMEAKYPDD